MLKRQVTRYFESYRQSLPSILKKKACLQYKGDINSTALVFDPPDELIDRIEWHMRHGSNQYAPMQGVALLRERISVVTCSKGTAKICAATKR